MTLVLERLRLKQFTKFIILFFLKIKRKCILLDNHHIDISEYGINVQRDVEWGKTEEYDLTFIVPIYNVEKYIRRCVLSLLNQTTNFCFQILLVDDGSTDGSIDQVKDLLNNGNILLISKENGGLSSARNAGLDIVKSKYITFVDSDDFIDQNFTEKMLSYAKYNKAKIVQCDFGLVDVDDNILSYVDFRRQEKYDVPGYSCGKIFCTDLFGNIQFPIGCWFEDTIINSLIVAQIDSIYFVSEPLYLYRQNPAGITSNSRFDIRSYDTYNLTYGTLEVRKKLKMENDCTYLKYFLKLVILNYNRTLYLNKEINKNFFYKTCILTTQYFDKGLIEDYIRNKYMNYDLLVALVNNNYYAYNVNCFFA